MRWLEAWRFPRGRMPRFTRDVDLAVAVTDDQQAEQLVRGLRGEGYGVVAVVEQEATRRLSTARLAGPVGEQLIVDLLFASSGIEAELVANAESLQLADDLAVPVATTPYLIATKTLAQNDQRLQDRIDLQALLAVASAADLDLARRATADSQPRLPPSQRFVGGSASGCHRSKRTRSVSTSGTHIVNKPVSCECLVNAGHRLAGSKSCKVAARSLAEMQAFAGRVLAEERSSCA